MSDVILVKLEDGRIIDRSPMADGKGVLELVDGRLVKPAKSVSVDALYHGTPIPNGERLLKRSK